MHVLATDGHSSKTGSVLEAGLLWRRWCETLGRQRTQSWSIRVDRKNAADMTENGLAAAATLRAAAAAVGPERTELLLLLIVDDCRWAVICAVAGVKDPKTVKDRCAEALAALASWLAGRRVPDPTRKRPHRRAESR